MSIVVPNTSDLLMLNYILNKTTTSGDPPVSGGNRELRLFSNNIVPTKTTVIGDLTHLTAAGYSLITLNGSSWTIETVDGINKATYPESIFTITESVDIYGYYVTSVGGGELLFVERFSTAPFSLPPGGGTIGITLEFALN